MLKAHLCIYTVTILQGKFSSWQAAKVKKLFDHDVMWSSNYKSNLFISCIPCDMRQINEMSQNFNLLVTSLKGIDKNRIFLISHKKAFKGCIEYKYFELLHRVNPILQNIILRKMRIKWNPTLPLPCLFQQVYAFLTNVLVIAWGKQNEH